MNPTKKLWWGRNAEEPTQEVKPYLQEIEVRFPRLNDSSQTPEQNFLVCNHLIFRMCKSIIVKKTIIIKRSAPKSTNSCKYGVRGMIRCESSSGTCSEVT